MDPGSQHGAQCVKPDDKTFGFETPIAATRRKTVSRTEPGDTEDVGDGEVSTSSRAARATTREWLKRPDFAKRDQKPYAKPESITTRWDGAKLGTQEGTFRCLTFWQHLIKTVKRCGWDERLTMVYLSTHLDGEAMALFNGLREETFDAFKKTVEMRYMYHLRGEELMARVYQVRQREGENAITYLERMKEAWRFVGALDIMSELSVVGVYFLQLREDWVRANQAIFLSMRTECKSLEDIETELGINARILVERHEPRGGSGGSGSTAATIATAGAPSGGERKCWICNKPGHNKQQHREWGLDRDGNRASSPRSTTGPTPGTAQTLISSPPGAVVAGKGAGGASPGRSSPPPSNISRTSSNQ